MAGKINRESMVGGGARYRHGPPRKGNGKKKTIALLVVAGILISVMVVMGTAGNMASEQAYAYPESRSTHGVLGAGNTTPEITAGKNSFAVAWYGYDNGTNQWNLNVSFVSIDGGSVTSTVKITSDLYIKYGKPSGLSPKICYDTVNDDYLLIWYSENKSLDGIIIKNDGTALTDVFVINGTKKVDYHAFGLSFVGAVFVVSWQDTSYDNWFRNVSYDSSSGMKMDPIIQLSKDTVHTHLNQASAYDISAEETGFVWRNSTGTSGNYNITMKLYTNGVGSVMKNDFTIADGFGDGKAYDMPNIANDENVFMVVYANRNSPYTVYGAFVDHTGNIVKRITIGTSYTGIKYYGIGITRNVTEGFVVTWPDSDKNIVAAAYNDTGALIWEKTIVSDGNASEGPRVAMAYDTNGNANYTFVWYDYTNGLVKIAFYSSDEFVPELGPMLIVLVPILAVIALRRKR